MFLEIQVFIAVFYLKLNLNMKIDQRVFTFKNLREICQKPVPTL